MMCTSARISSFSTMQALISFSIFLICMVSVAIVCALILLCNFDWRMLEQLLNRIQDLGLKNKSGDTMANSLLAYELLECLAFSRQKTEPAPKLANLMEFMRKNLAKPLTLHDLAKEYGSSESTLLQTFHAVYGKTPHAQLIELRMEQAAKLLLASPWLSIKEVADQTGYSNSMNFSTAFRRCCGMSPREYRKLKFHGSSSDNTGKTNSTT